MNCEIISIGTELLLGQIVNSNAAYLSEQLSDLGIDVFYHTVVGDNGKRLKETVEMALRRSDLIITTGGLGPTMDDLTKETIAAAIDRKMILYPEAEQHIKSFFLRIGKTMTDNNLKQAMFPEGARLFTNRYGTAPGMAVFDHDKLIITLPGPPSELKKMFTNEVIPFLVDYLQLERQTIKSKLLRLYGIGESAIEEEIKDILDEQTNPTIALLAKQSEINIRITAKSKDEETAKALIEQREKLILNRIGKYVFGIDNQDMEDRVAEELMNKSLTIALAESCTGGLISHRLTNVPGSSAYLERSIVCYSNRSKIELLNVDEELISKYGSVSSQVAIAMAEGIRAISGVDLGVGVTGIAGPDGGTTEKPVGLVYFALATREGIRCEKHLYSGGRKGIKQRASQTALDLIRRYLLNIE